MSHIEDELNLTLGAVKLYRSEEDFRRIPLSVEQEIIDKIKLGDYQNINLSTYDKIKDNIGMYTTSTKLSLTFLVVSAVTLFGRAAIDGGALPDDVFDLSDTFLHLLTKPHSNEELFELYQLVPVRFAHLVHLTKENTPNFQVAQMQGYISSNIFNKISITDLAEYSSLSESHICHLFKKEFGITVHNYIQKEKITVACNLLKHTQRSVSDISNYMGFQTPSNFTEVFRKWMKMTPTAYRHQNYREVY